MSTDESYFSEGAATAEAGGEAGWYNLDADIERTEILPGLYFQPVVGSNLAINRVFFEPNAEAPRHAHEEEQIVAVLEGELEFEVNGETRMLGPGSVLVIPPWTSHAARTHDNTCLAIDTFSPPRTGLAEIMSAALARKRESTGGE